MELKNAEELRNEILQYWLRSAWVYPFEGPDERTYLRLTPGGRLKMRRRIGELEKALGVEGTELARQDEAGTLPVERDRLELAMMVQAYDTERRLLVSTFLIDIDAMVFGMPRALFPALGTTLYGGGAATVGLLYAANTGGSILGWLGAGFVLAGTMGTNGSILLLGGLNLLAGVDLPLLIYNTRLILSCR